jgi:hypothetical protein
MSFSESAPQITPGTGVKTKTQKKKKIGGGAVLSVISQENKQNNYSC